MSQDQSLKSTSELYGTNALYIAEVYERYLEDPSSVDASWGEYFKNIGDNAASLKSDFGSAPWARSKSKIVGAVDPETLLAAKAAGLKKDGAKGSDKAPAAGAASPETLAVLYSVRAHMLIRAYRIRGHLLADLDPLGLMVRESHPELELSRYGFSDADMEKEIAIDGWLGFDKLKLKDILAILKETYCGKIGVEMAHMQNLDRRAWVEKKLEESRSKVKLSTAEKKEVLQKLVEVVGFEEFLHKKFPGAKRFSVEGGDNLLTAMEAVISQSARLGIKEVVLGMPHRGRLNVLTAFMGKSYTAMLSEFQGNLANPDWVNASGDVKYHLGYSSDKEFDGNSVHLSLTPNPSHLETVNSIVTGKVRAKQDQMRDTARKQAMGLLLHGDAAFCGQGVVSETLYLSELQGYQTGGTIHIVVNNQVGFTTTPREGHHSPYPTDVAMSLQSPIFHVNGDDPEAVVHVARIAADYRQEFQQDVVIDIWCYRKHGHNEGDEPRWTQPKMYAVIDQKETPREIYAKQLLSENVVSTDDIEKLKQDFYNRLDEAYTKSNSFKPNKADMLEGKWEGLEQVRGEKGKMETGVELKKLQEIGTKLSTHPEGFTLHKGVEKVMQNRRKMAEDGTGIDWAFAEALAFGSLVTDGKPVRLSGQDVIRGTFSHRHSGVWDQNTQEIYFPLNHLSKDQAKYEAINSNLSEYAVLGYEYGYSSAEPNTLVLWEGQFGDFYNGAQIVVDQYIASGEVKWLRFSGLVMLLPHGYEGQGPEHSSARIERFLQMCAEDNWIVANVTTPANYFHILRRQLTRNYRKPLVLFSPKSLLRHKRAQSSLKEMAIGTTFHRVLPETSKDLVADAKIKRVVLCSGKVYYDLLEAREEREIDDVALVRVEQLYPFPHDSVKTELLRYKNAEVIWAQEEPNNMGAWTYMDRKIEAVMAEVAGKSTRPACVSRPEAAATACGYMRIHQKEQAAVIDGALTVPGAKAAKPAGKIKQVS